jgi:hypothetical protein
MNTEYPKIEADGFIEANDFNRKSHRKYRGGPVIEGIRQGEELIYGFCPTALL